MGQANLPDQPAEDLWVGDVRGRAASDVAGARLPAETGEGLRRAGDSSKPVEHRRHPTLATLNTCS
eukprot:9411705-Pyramimonas_sp.AAC.1